MLSFTPLSDSKKVILAKADSFAIDNLGNALLIRNNEIVKYLASGKYFTRYSNLQLGNVTSVDVMNPLKILVYYRDYQQIVFLDDQLSVNSDNISLELLGYQQTDLVCASMNNSFWIYDKQNNELIRFDENSNKISQTGNLKQVLRSDISPNFMLEHNGYLYVNSPNIGIYVFDIFAAFSRIVSIKNLKNFQVNGNVLYYKTDSTFCSYDYKTFNEGCIVIEKNVKQLIKQKDILAKLYTDSIVVEGAN